MPRQRTRASSPYVKLKGGVDLERPPHPRDKRTIVHVTSQDIIRRPREKLQNRSWADQNNGVVNSAPHEFDVTAQDVVPSEEGRQNSSHRAPDESTGQVVYTLDMEFAHNPSDEIALSNARALRVRKVIGPLDPSKSVDIICNLPKARSGRITCRITRGIVGGEGDQLGDLSTLAEPEAVDVVKQSGRES